MADLYLHLPGYTLLPNKTLMDMKNTALNGRDVASSLFVSISVWIGWSLLGMVVASDSECNIEIINTLNLMLRVTF